MWGLVVINEKLGRNNFHMKSFYTVAWHSVTIIITITMSVLNVVLLI